MSSEKIVLNGRLNSLSNRFSNHFFYLILQTITDTESTIAASIERFAQNLCEQFVQLHGALQNIEHRYLADAIEMFKRTKAQLAVAKQNIEMNMDIGQVYTPHSFNLSTKHVVC